MTSQYSDNLATEAMAQAILAEDEAQRPPVPEFHIPFIHCLPFGVSAPMHFPCDKPLHQKAAKIIEAGFQLHAEVLRTEEVSFTICHPLAGDMAIVVCRSGPEVPGKVAALVARFNITVALKNVDLFLAAQARPRLARNV
jgi:hypothetical protein